ncbi:MAG: precorrin-8X methylmutase [Rhizobiaceae bacterium]|nr:precorrin-8X methylmutase [Rhizobiaceae bacterium]
MSAFDYIRDPAEIYRQSFSIVERESRLGLFPEDMRSIATRLIHSCGMVDIVHDLAFSKNAASAGREALASGGAIFTDVEMVKSGIIERFLTNSNDIVCTLNDPRVPDHANAISNTRSAAAVDLWDDRLEGAIVVVGNAPTALFRLLERIDDGAPKPALVIGIPVGFVGAIESKQALAENSSGLEFITVHGRRGGSAMASSVVNALAGGLG